MIELLGSNAFEILKRIILKEKFLMNGTWS